MATDRLDEVPAPVARAALDLVDAVQGEPSLLGAAVSVETSATGDVQVRITLRPVVEQRFTIATVAQISENK